MGFYLNLLGEYEKGVGRKRLIDYSYLIMLTKIWDWDWNYQLKIMNLKVDEENGKALGMVNRQYQKVWQFSSNEFWKNIGCLVSAPIFVLIRSRMWEKEYIL